MTDRLPATRRSRPWLAAAWWEPGLWRSRPDRAPCGPAMQRGHWRVVGVVLVEPVRLRRLVGDGCAHDASRWRIGRRRDSSWLEDIPAMPPPDISPRQPYFRAASSGSAQHRPAAAARPARPGTPTMRDAGRARPCLRRSPSDPSSLTIDQPAVPASAPAPPTTSLVGARRRSRYEQAPTVRPGAVTPWRRGSPSG